MHSGIATMIQAKKEFFSRVKRTLLLLWHFVLKPQEEWLGVFYCSFLKDTAFEKALKKVSAGSGAGVDVSDGAVAEIGCTAFFRFHVLRAQHRFFNEFFRESTFFQCFCDGNQTSTIVLSPASALPRFECLPAPL